MIQSKNRKYINFDIDSGAVCYSCKENINHDYDTLIVHPHNRELCIKCKRNKSLESILENKKLNMTHLVYSKNWQTILMNTSMFAIIIPKLSKF